jgi:hypothetical protein
MLPQKVSFVSAIPFIKFGMTHVLV